jgi:hypothetical protein
MEPEGAWPSSQNHAIGLFLSWFTPVNIFTTYFSEMLFNIFPPSEWSVTMRYSSQNVAYVSCYHVCAICANHSNSTWRIGKFRSYLLHNFFSLLLHCVSNVHMFSPIHIKISLIWYQIIQKTVNLKASVVSQQTNIDKCIILNMLALIMLWVSSCTV